MQSSGAVAPATAIGASQKNGPASGVRVLAGAAHGGGTAATSLALGVQAASVAQELATLHAAAGASVATRAIERRGLRVLDYVTLLAIGALVVGVSLPRLRAFALRENERDAMHALRLLAADAEREPEVLRAGGLPALLAANGAHRVRLDDVELYGTRQLRRHGYLFDAVEVGTGRFVLRAWPWEHGHTGLAAFETAGGRPLYGSANKNGGYSGPAAPPPALAAPAAAGWLALADE
jgi:hypothetical protein